MIQGLLSQRPIRFILSGGCATAIHLLIASAWLWRFEQQFFQANLIGFTCAFVFSYLVQTTWVFRQQLALRNGLRFFLVQSMMLVCSMLIAEHTPLLNSLQKTLLVVVLMPIISYLLHKFWTFSAAKAPN